MLKRVGNSILDNELASPYRVLVADPSDKLKLTRWRLQSDGHGVHYVQDTALIEPLVQKEDIHVVVLNVCVASDFQLLKKVSELKDYFQIVAIVDTARDTLINEIIASGASTTVTRPIDYPKLSSVVNEQMELAAAKKRKSNMLGQLKKTLNLPININSTFKTVLEQLKPGILIVDAAGQITLVNKAMSGFLSSSGKNLLGQDFTVALNDTAGQSQALLLKILGGIFAQRGTSISEEIIFPNGLDDSTPCQAEAHPIVDKKGEFAGAFVIMEDITRPKNLEKVMVQSEKLAMVGQLAAGAAHEIKNPLTSVRGFIQLLQTELADSPKGEYIDIIINEIDRVNAIINEFLILAKPATPNRKGCSLRELFEDIRILVESEAFIKNIEIIGDPPDSLPLIQIDSEQVKQVLINVIRNSFEAMAGGGTISVNAIDLPDNQQICLKISDTGVGIAKENMEKVSVPFFTTKENGTGLGLSVSSEIMKGHGGSLHIDSEQGQGTTIALYFPYK